MVIETRYLGRAKTVLPQLSGDSKMHMFKFVFVGTAIFRVIASFKALFLVLPLMACQSFTSDFKVEQQALDRMLAGEQFSAELEAQGYHVGLIVDDHPLQLTSELKGLAHRVAPPDASQNFKVRELVRFLLSSGGANLKYNSFRTHTASETFYKSEANCLSFTLLFVAMAEEVGLKAYFNEVDVPPVWDVQGDDRLIYYRHVNAVVELPLSFKKIVDINMSEYDTQYPQRRISRASAEAMYYNNRGSELMYEKEYGSAFLYFKKALILKPDASYIWGNLASLYRRMGDEQLAEAGYRYALNIGGFHPVVAGNLARLLRSNGRVDEAIEFELAVNDFRNRNPYYHFSLASHDYQNGQYQAASNHLDEAVRLYRYDHRFYRLRAMLDFKVGNFSAALDDLELASRYATDEALKLKYQNKLERLRECKECNL